MSKRNVVVVDDDPLLGSILGGVIEEAGFRCVITAGAAECMPLIDKLTNPDRTAAILLDIFMPETDGIEFMRALAARHCRVPLIVMSSAQDYLAPAEEFGRLWGLQVLETMLKPISLDRLKGRLEHLRTPEEAQQTAIMLVDSDERVRDAASAALTGEGFEVLVAAHGAEALERLRGHGNVDFVVIDLDMMPRDGLSLMHALEHLRPQTKIILTSEKIAAVPATYAAFLRKPAQPGDMARIIRELTLADETPAQRSVGAIGPI